jgi:hypothetical protein
MTYETCINQILEFAGEGYTGQSALARTVFRQVIAEKMLDAAVGDDELPGLMLIDAKTMAEGASTIDLTTIDGFMQLIDLFPGPEDEDGYMYRELSKAERDRIAYDDSFLPGTNELGWYRVGKTIYFVPAANASGRTVNIKYKRTPLDYASTVTVGKWDDTTEMDNYLTYPMQSSCILMAADRLKQLAERR